MSWMMGDTWQCEPDYPLPSPPRKGEGAGRRLDIGDIRLRGHVVEFFQNSRVPIRVFATANLRSETLGYVAVGISNITTPLEPTLLPSVISLPNASEPLRTRCCSARSSAGGCS